MLINFIFRPFIRPILIRFKDGEISKPLVRTASEINHFKSVILRIFCFARNTPLVTISQLKQLAYKNGSSLLYR